MPKQYVSAVLKQLVFDRASGLCEYCRSQAKFAIDPLIIEHIQPISRGGETASENLALACQTCNNYKYTKTEAPDPVSDRIVPLFHPRQMKWQDHFVWDEDATRMLGITPTGRAMIALLQTNRNGVINIRRVLTIMGYHPPN